MRVLSRLLGAFVFFTLFAFALNNQQMASVRFFFGLQWQGPMVFVVLVAFGAGCALGVLAMAPHWWRQRREVKRLAPVGATPAPGEGAVPSKPGSPTDSPPRESL
jgi:lipopolysaccharide assembly protein A